MMAADDINCIFDIYKGRILFYCSFFVGGGGKEVMTFFTIYAHGGYVAALVICPMKHWQNSEVFKKKILKIRPSIQKLSIVTA